MTISPQEIFHALSYNDAFRTTKPRSMSDLDDWINDARQAIEASSDMIEALAHELQNARGRDNAGLTILDALTPHLENTLPHLFDCQRDWENVGYPHVVWMAGGCKACETLALIRYHLDETVPHLNTREIETATGARQ